MPLDSLVHAKKSFSGIFSRMSIVPIQPCSPKQNENDAPSRETPGPCSPGVGSTEPDAGDESPTKETTSMRKGLVGSLRKQKLRSISSLRSLRSPTKTKQSDTSESPLADSPRTPKHRLNSSLVLHFEESPPDRLIFDFDRQDSPTSGLRVHHSSPVPVPSSDRQIPRSPVCSSLIPSGTVPPSPAPIQKFLNLDQTRIPPSSTFTPPYDSDSETMRKPASTKNALSDSLRDASVYFDEPLVRFTNSEPNDYFTVPLKTEELTQESGREDSSWINRAENLSDYDEQCKAPGDTTNETVNATNMENTPEEKAQLILEKGYHARVYRRADGQRRLRIRLLAFDPDDGDDESRWDTETPFRLAALEEDKLASQISAIIRETGITSMSHGRIDEAFAAGKLPAYLDVDPDWDVAKDSQSHLHSPTTTTRKRDSTWGQHTGLYDGTGYGAGSSSRPVTGVTETADIPRTRIPETFIDHENEAPVIIRRLCDNTYPHIPGTDSHVQATAAGPATSEAQERPQSDLDNYKVFQGMLNPRSNT